MHPCTAQPARTAPDRGRTDGMARTAALLAILAGAGLLASPGRAADLAALRIDSAIVVTDANGAQRFVQPLAVAVDGGHDEIVVANTGLSRIEFFARDGRPRGSFVHRVTNPEGVDVDGLPRFIATTADGRVLVSDTRAAYVDVCDFRGASLQRIALPAPDDRIADGNGPGAIAVAPDGRILVASRGEKGRVHVFSPEGQWLATWGVAGSAPGQLAAVTALAAAPAGEVVVACASTDLSIQVFDASGEYLRGFGVHDIGPGNFSLPNGVVVTPDSRVWVSDGIRHLVQVFEITGQLVGVVGGGEESGALNYPSALASDGRGLFALAERGGNRLVLWWIR